jgi:serine/threonine protein kinase
MATDRYGPYILGTKVSLSRTDIEKLLEVFGGPTGKSYDLSGGRVPIHLLSLDSVGAVAVKHYRRGGLVRWLNKTHYIKTGRLRSQKEYKMLQLAHRCGIQVPAPVAWAARGGLVYRCWLVTEAIPSAITLAQISRTDPTKSIQYTRCVSRQIRRLIQHRILHVDLHPGNIVIGTGGRVVLIDFDRARRYDFSPSALAKRYRIRWQRAVVKHNLPKFLIAEMEAGLTEATKAP